MATVINDMSNLGEVREDSEKLSGNGQTAEGKGLLARYFNWSIGTKLYAMNGISGVFGAVLVGSGWYFLNAIETALLESGVNAPAIVELAHSGKTAFVVMLVVAIIWSVVANYRLGKDISTSLKRIAPTLADVVDGKTNVNVPYIDNGDEIGEIARSVEAFRRTSLKLQNIRGEQDELRKSQTGKLQEMAVAFEEMIGNVAGNVASASTQLQSTASSMASSAENSASQVSSVTSAMEDASKGVTAAAAASDEFAMSIGEISRQASSSAELARKATGAAEEADATISTLSVSAEEVGQVVELIQSIAQRTNLLALNASIEAARGGDSGRGFAVVASEVKELASQTSKATQNVADQINTMQESTSASVEALRSIGTQIQQLEATAVSIAAAVDQQAVAGQDLARSIDIAARGADEASTNIGKVHDTSLATGAAASQVLDSSTDLEQQAVMLKDHVGKFLGHVRKLDFFA